MLLISEVVSLGIFLLGIIIVIKYKSQKLDKNSKNILDKQDKFIITCLTSIYFIISLVNLGSPHNFPLTWKAQQTNTQLTIVLKKPSQIGKLYYYSGINNGQYHWSYIDSKDQEQIISDPNTNLGDPAHFRWNKINLDDTNQQITTLKLTIDQPELDLRQIALYTPDGGYISHATVKASNTTQSLNELISPTRPNYVDNSLLSSSYFDEIFYATTAYQYLHGLNPYVAVHPPLGMLFIAIGIAIFGMTAFGWRIIPDIAATLIIPVVYILAKRIFKSRVAAILASLLIIFEPMHFVMGHIAFLDGIVTLFILLEYYFLYQYLELRTNTHNLYQCLPSWLWIGISMGVAMSCKWSGLYFALPLLIGLIYGEIFINKPTFKQFIISFSYAILTFVLLPLIIYSLSYVPFIYSQTDTELFSFIWRIQTYMYDFQAHGLANATHPYASSWYEWPSLKKPMSIFFWSDPKSSLAVSIAFIANPLISILTFPIIVSLAILGIIQKKFQPWFIFSAICAQLLPYAFITHIMFLYYFYSTIPLIILGIVYLQQQLNWQKPLVRYITYGYLLAVIIVFLWFIPVTSGFEFSRELVSKYLLWRDGWNF